MFVNLFDKYQLSKLNPAIKKIINQTKPFIKKKVKLPNNKNLVNFFFDKLLTFFFNGPAKVSKIYQYDLYLLYKFPQAYPLR